MEGTNLATTTTAEISLSRTWRCNRVTLLVVVREVYHYTPLVHKLQLLCSLQDLAAFEYHFRRNTAIFPLHTQNKQTKKELRGFWSASELYDWATVTCREILVSTFADRWVSRRQRGGTPTAVNLTWQEPLLFSFKYLLI
jgi:hypothetical protein